MMGLARDRAEGYSGAAWRQSQQPGKKVRAPFALLAPSGSASSQSLRRANGARTGKEPGWRRPSSSRPDAALSPPGLAGLAGPHRAGAGGLGVQPLGAEVGRPSDPPG